MNAISKLSLLRGPVRAAARRFISSANEYWRSTELRIPTPNGSLALKSWGDMNKKPILALHGWQDNANTYDKLVPLLSPDHWVLALDFSGHGYSSHIPSGVPYSPSTFFLDIQRVADYFDWEEFSIIGHSMGGGIAHLYSVMFPERLKSLVTIDVPLPSVMTTDQVVMMTVMSTMGLLRIEKQGMSEKPFAYPEAEIIEKHLSAIPNAYTPEAIKTLMGRGCTRIAEDLYTFNRDRRLKFILYNSVDVESSEKLAARYKNELLAIRCLPLQFVREGYERIQAIHRENCSRYIYEQVEGLHHIHLTEPEKIAPLINDFLADKETPST